MGSIKKEAETSMESLAEFKNRAKAFLPPFIFQTRGMNCPTWHSNAPMPTPAN